MQSPFPGMDPYLELLWRDVHHRLCTYACDQVQDQLGSDLLARLDERLVVESLVDEGRSIFPDVRVVEHGLHDVEVSPAAASVGTVTEPLLVSILSDPTREGFIEIIEPDSGRVVTVIEFLSPTNKMPGDGKVKYEQKQRELYEARTNLVEIDLTRAGRRRLLVPAAQMPKEAANAAYQACVFRGYRPDKLEIYPMPLREHLPTIRVPLRQTDPDVVLNLQSLIEQVYRKGRYSITDYRKPCVPPLDPADDTWAAELLRAAGKR